MKKFSFPSIFYVILKHNVKDERRENDFAIMKI